ncbi:MAG: PqiC family protein, partial [Deltaproteobacteria bacterium]|nr:PqiC family protein [Kofleriaceae bacterium]
MRCPRTPAPLRLGRVDRADVLGHRIVQRTSGVELALYETRRWTESPDEYVRRALLRALFEERPLAETRIRSAPTLEIEVIAFEEVMTPRHAGRVQLRFVLHDHRTVLASGQIAADAPVTGEGFDAVVLAIATANRDATTQLADRVMRELCPDATTH